MKFIRIILLIGISGIFTPVQAETLKQILIRLDNELKTKDIYDSYKQSRIDSMCLQLPTQHDNPKALCMEYCKIAREYETFISDSALAYYDRATILAKELNDTTPAIQARLGRIKVMSIMGFFHEAMTELDSIEQNGIPVILKEQWLDCGRQLYSYIEAYTIQGNSQNMNPYLDTT